MYPRSSSFCSTDATVVGDQHDAGRSVMSVVLGRHRVDVHQRDQAFGDLEQPPHHAAELVLGGAVDHDGVERVRDLHRRARRRSSRPGSSGAHTNPLELVTRPFAGAVAAARTAPASPVGHPTAVGRATAATTASAPAPTASRRRARTPACPAIAASTGGGARRRRVRSLVEQLAQVGGGRHVTPRSGRARACRCRAAPAARHSARLVWLLTVPDADAERLGGPVHREVLVEPQHDHRPLLARQLRAAAATGRPGRRGRPMPSGSTLVGSTSVGRSLPGPAPPPRRVRGHERPARVRLGRAAGRGSGPRPGRPWSAWSGAGPRRAGDHR